MESDKSRGGAAVQELAAPVYKDSNEEEQNVARFDFV